MKTTSWYRSSISVGLLSVSALCVTGCVGTIGDLDSTEDLNSNEFLIGSSEVAQNAIKFGLTQLSSKIGSVYVGGCSSQRFGGAAGGYFNGSCVGQSNYHQSAGRVGYDCSGLVYRMFKEAGISLGGIASSAAMYDKLIPIEKSQILPGDLLVKSGSHVAMYIGNDQVIEATSYGSGTVTKEGVVYRDNWPGVHVIPAAKYMNNGDYHARRVPGVQTASSTPEPTPEPTTMDSPPQTGEPSGMPVPPPLPARLQLVSPHPLRIFDKADVTAGISEQIDVRKTGVPITGVNAVVLNLVVDKPEGDGYARVWSADQNEPNTSDINFKVGETRANLIVVRVTDLGMVNVALSTGHARMVIDVVGYFAESGNLGFSPVTQRRVTPAPVEVPAHGTRDVNLGISHSAAAISLTATGGASSSYLAVYRQGTGIVGPFSTLNYAANQNIANQAWVEPNSGNITISNNGDSSVKVFVDINAAFDANSNIGFVPFAAPRRSHDTRLLGLKQAGESNVPLSFVEAGVPDSAIGLAYNLTFHDPSESTYGSLYASGDWPNISLINADKGSDVASGGATAMGGDHRIWLKTGSGPTHVIMDVAGYFAP